MADLLIRGMEMPKSCTDCPCAYFTEGVSHDFCQAVGYETNIEYEPYPKNKAVDSRPDWCPLVEVPDHGPLGDLDVLYNAVEQRYKLSSGIEHRCERDLLDLICNSDTIIPASPADRSNTPDDSPQIQIVADALKRGFYGTMYGQKYAKGDKLIFIKPGEAWASNDVLFFRWGYPGPDVNTYKPEDYGKTWALTGGELTESIQSDPADKEGGE